MNIPSADPFPSLLTRASLLLRLRDWEDAVSWSEFYRLYFKLVYSHGRRSGLGHGGAEEVAQDVFRNVAESIGSFAPQPQCGSFRRWLLNLTRWRIIDHKRQHNVPAAQVSQWRPELEEGAATLIESLPDPIVAEEILWENEWQAGVLETALERVARKVPAKKFQAFELYTRRQWPALKVARELGINLAGVYLISHRVTRKLKREVDRLTDEIG